MSTDATDRTHLSPSIERLRHSQGQVTHICNVGFVFHTSNDTFIFEAVLQNTHLLSNPVFFSFLIFSPVLFLQAEGSEENVSSIPL